MLSLSIHTPRCQGRYARVMGGDTLAAECVRCLRRTTPLPTVVKPAFITPPTSPWCGQRIDPDERMEAAC